MRAPKQVDSFGRTPLEVLQFELDFVEQGGYGRSVRTPRTPRVPFMDSPSCLNFLEADRPHACNGCALMEFVPEAAQGEAVPCHHIPLDPQGHTIASLYDPNDESRVLDAVAHWLHFIVGQLRSERHAAEDACEHQGSSCQTTPKDASK
ncbi:MAG: hypothetical protein HYX28_02895 [Candidatus Koribacter versatilis]|uniref:Uncharacterized protein n=1 Tax=Candidatus Korobacter versatilis TaxID=658062 RepID=A0A932A8V6_9BACT|nr:hypothetical protein [Candidatus Koribacter versatilis]